MSFTAALRWRHPGPGRFEVTYGGHELSVVADDTGLWSPLVDGKPAPAPVEARNRFPTHEQAKTAAVKSLMPIHKIVISANGYCVFNENLPPGWFCQHDRYWIGHEPGNWEQP